MAWKCGFCGEIIEKNDKEDVEEMLWGHIQIEHSDKHREMQDWDTPWMLNRCYILCQKGDYKCSR